MHERKLPRTPNGIFLLLLPQRESSADPRHRCAHFVLRSRSTDSVALCERKSNSLVGTNGRTTEVVWILEIQFRERILGSRVPLPLAAASKRRACHAFEASELLLLLHCFSFCHLFYGGFNRDGRRSSRSSSSVNSSSICV